MRANTKRV